MKTKTLFNQLYPAFSKALLLLFVFYGCGNENERQQERQINEIYPVIDKVQAVDGKGIRDIRVYIIDSCEYIGHINQWNADFLTHKGNCKFCIERSRK